MTLLSRFMTFLVIPPLDGKFTTHNPLMTFPTEAALVTCLSQDYTPNDAMSWQPRSAGTPRPGKHYLPLLQAVTRVLIAFVFFICIFLAWPVGFIELLPFLKQI
jgi:hypothetical protein